MIDADWDKSAAPDPGPGWRLVDVRHEQPSQWAEMYEPLRRQWCVRLDYHKPYVDGVWYRVPTTDVVVQRPVLGLPNVPVLESDEYEPESYEDRVASSRMIGQVLFGAVCFFAGGVVGWITSLVCSWLLN